MAVASTTTPAGLAGVVAGQQPGIPGCASNFSPIHSGNGLLRLHDSSHFELSQIEVAGSGVKLQNTATNLVALHDFNTRPANTPDETGLPALQMAGISIIRPEKSLALKATFTKAYALNAALVAIDQSPVSAANVPGPPPTPTDELYAEDVVRGYRIDVFDDQSNTWHSLCRRVGTYHFVSRQTGIAAPAALQLRIPAACPRGRPGREQRLHA